MIASCRVTAHSAAHSASDWRERYAHKLTTPEEAVGLVRDGTAWSSMHYDAAGAVPGAGGAARASCSGVEIEN
jgi:hypothetical protein